VAVADTAAVRNHLQVPEEVLDQLDWASKHDQEAQAMGQAAQQFAVKYLNRKARACWWFKWVTHLGLGLQLCCHVWAA
jgi:hypothetical protein